MAWFKVDDQLAFNAKVVAAENEAMGLWVRCGSWSSAQLTDGFIPTHMANAIANGMAKECGADALVMAGLWDEVEGGYQFHDWSEFQPDAETEKAKRKKRSLAGQKGAAARWGSKSDSKPHGKSHGKPMANECDWDAPTRPDPTLTEPKGSVSDDSTSKAAYPQAFEDFWNVYPKKADKRAALKAWNAATKRAGKGAIEAGAEAYRDDPNRQDAYTKNASTWLNADAWANDLLPARPSGRDQPRNRADDRMDQNRAVIEELRRIEEENADTIQGELL